MGTDSIGLARSLDQRPIPRALFGLLNTARSDSVSTADFE